MPVIPLHLSDREMAAISEYAIQCGETVPDLVRKIAVRQATLADWFGHLDSEYDLQMQMPEKCTASARRRLTESNYNKIRHIMGLKKIRL